MRRAELCLFLSQARLMCNSPSVSTAPEAPWFWLAVRTRPRHEKKLKFRASRERNSQLSSALPREAPLERPHSQRVELPMFSQYLFVRVPTSGDSLLQTAGVVQLVGATVRGTPIPDAQIEALLAIVSHGIPTAPREFLRVGQRVRFRLGVLDGIEGVVSAIRNEKEPRRFRGPHPEVSGHTNLTDLK